MADGYVQNLSDLVDMAIGSVDLSKHPEWKNDKAIAKWLEDIRQDRDEKFNPSF